LILLTATPINNNIFDLYNQINLFAGNDRTYFAVAGIGDLYKYFLAARRDSIEQGSIRIFNLLEEVVVRRTRQFIRRAYPEATINGKTITWPARRLVTLKYDLAATYEGFYADIVRRIEQLKLPHYNLETYKATNAARDEFELGRQQALVGIFKSRFLKRLESSIDAFRISIRRARWSLPRPSMNTSRKMWCSMRRHFGSRCSCWIRTAPTTTTARRPRWQVPSMPLRRRGPSSRRCRVSRQATTTGAPSIVT
jgi:hypothetical protein